MAYQGLPHGTSALVRCALVCALLADATGCAAPGTVNIPAAELKAKYGTADDRYFAHHGLEVWYRDEGSGPVVVLLHGICPSLETWDGWARAIETMSAPPRASTASASSSMLMRSVATIGMATIPLSR